MLAHLQLVSLSYKQAPVALRELWALGTDQRQQLYQQLLAHDVVREVLIVATCNRTEVLIVADQPIKTILMPIWAKLVGQEDDTHDLLHLEYVIGAEAAQHLLEVTAGLKSHVPGDIQIASQVKASLHESVSHEAAGPIIQKLVQMALAATKRVATETAFRSGSASVSYSAATAVAKHCHNRQTDLVILAGLGKMGCEVVTILAKLGFRNILLANRTEAVAIGIRKELMQDYHDWFSLEVCPLIHLHRFLDQARVVIGAMEVKAPFFREAHLSQRTAQHQPTLWLDLGVPRNVDPHISELPQQCILHIDQLGAVAEQALLSRKASIPRVETIVNEALEQFLVWMDERIVGASIHLLKQKLVAICQQELNRYNKMVSEDQQVLLQQLTNALVQRIVKLPARQLRALAADQDHAKALARSLETMFEVAA